MAYENIFDGIARAKPISSYEARLPVGHHKIALKRFGVKKSEMGSGNILEADFMVLESNTLTVGETRGWAWFIDSQGLAGQYEQSRAQDFLATIGKCIEDTSPVTAIGASLVNPSQPGRGIVIAVEITAQANKDGSPKLNPKTGAAYTNARWAPVKQDGESIVAIRAQLDRMENGMPSTVAAPTTTAALPQAAPPPAPAPAAAAAPAPAASGLLGGLMNRNK